MSDGKIKYQDPWMKDHAEKRALSDRGQSVGSVSGEEIHNALERFLEENPTISLPYGGTEGYWNAFLSRFRQMGFEIKRKPNNAIESSTFLGIEICSMCANGTCMSEDFDGYPCKPASPDDYYCDEDFNSYDAKKLGRCDGYKPNRFLAGNDPKRKGMSNYGNTNRQKWKAINHQ